MKVIVRSKTLEVTKALRNFIGQQAQKIAKTGQKISKITVFLESIARKKNDLRSATVKFDIDIPGKNVVVKRHAQDMYVAIVDAANRARRYIRKTKEKRLTKKRHNGREQMPLLTRVNPQL